MILGILSARGPFSAQGSDFYDFGDLCDANPYLVLEVIFDGFWRQILLHFLIPFWIALFAKYGARSIENGNHLEVILMTFLGAAIS